MFLKQQKCGTATVKYSKIGDNGHLPTGDATTTFRRLLNNGFAIVDGYATLELIKLIKSLRELNTEYTMKTYETQEYFDGKTKYRGLYYEFTTVLFEDDRPEK